MVSLNEKWTGNGSTLLSTPSQPSQVMTPASTANATTSARITATAATTTSRFATTAAEANRRSPLLRLKVAWSSSTAETRGRRTRR